MKNNRLSRLGRQLRGECWPGVHKPQGPPPIPGLGGGGGAWGGGRREIVISLPFLYP